MTLVIRAGTLIDGTGREPVTDVLLFVEDGRVTRVVPETATSLPRDAPVLDFSGRTVLPGLIDCHVHLVFSGGETPLADLMAEDNFTILLRAAANARRALRAGVTTVRDLGGRAGTTMALRNAIDHGLLPGPHVMSCGSPITLTGGHCHFLGLEADSEDEVRQAVRSQIKRGVDGIKIMATGGGMTPRTNVRMAQYTVAQMSAAVEETHRARLTIAAHAHGTAGIRNATAAGVDTIEHCSWLDECDGQLRFDEEVAREMIARNVHIVSTMTPIQQMSVHRDVAARYNGLEFVAIFPTVVGLHRQMRDMGVRFVAGTDAGAILTPLDSLPWELHLMADRLGLTPLEAISAATGQAAQAIGLATDRGTVQAGMRADLVVVEGNPSMDLVLLRNVHAVLKDGVVVVQDEVVLDPPRWDPRSPTATSAAEALP